MVFCEPMCRQTAIHSLTASTQEGRPGWVGLGGWFDAEMVYPRTVTHLNTNAAQRTATLLMYASIRPLLRQYAHIFAMDNAVRYYKV